MLPLPITPILVMQRTIRRSVGGPGEEQLALPRIPRHRRGTLELRARLRDATEPREQVAADAREQVIAVERTAGRQLVHEAEPDLGPERHPDRDRAVELDDR